VVFPECVLTAETEKGYSKQASEIGFLGLAKVNSARLTHTLGSAQTRGLSLCTTGTKPMVSLVQFHVPGKKRSDTIRNRPAVASWRSGRTAALPYPPMLARSGYHDQI